MSNLVLLIPLTYLIIPFFFLPIDLKWRINNAIVQKKYYKILKPNNKTGNACLTYTFIFIIHNNCIKHFLFLFCSINRVTSHVLKLQCVVLALRNTRGSVGAAWGSRPREITHTPGAGRTHVARCRPTRYLRPDDASRRCPTHGHPVAPKSVPNTELALIKIMLSVLGIFPF